MGKARKKNIKNAKRVLLRESNKIEMGVASDEAMDNLLKVFQRLQKNK